MNLNCRLPSTAALQHESFSPATLGSLFDPFGGPGTVQLLLPTAPAGVTAGLSSATLTEVLVPPVTLRQAGVWGTPTVLSGPPTALHLDSAEKLNGLELAEDNYHVIQYQEKTRIMINCGISGLRTCQSLAG